ncbi:unnamed protein product, partial [Brenthis ino]
MNCQVQVQQQVRGRRRCSRMVLPAALGARRDRERERREERYAGSKWGAAPAAAALPPPPTHWRREGRCRPEPDRALPLKLLLNISSDEPSPARHLRSRRVPFKIREKYKKNNGTGKSVGGGPAADRSPALRPVAVALHPQAALGRSCDFFIRALVRRGALPTASSMWSRPMQLYLAPGRVPPASPRPRLLVSARRKT